uniref:Centrosome-associated FAM110 C-terminal domain-containing protein n=1 Tax=Lygus hesperus TaxID=30085 RepID=A0A0A9W7D7_LYGHE
MAATFQSPYGSMARDYLTFRTVNAKRKSAVEILQETKSLFVKSEAVLDAEQRLVKAAKCDGAYDSANRKDPTLAKIRRKVQPTHTRSCSDQLQTNLRRLLNSSSKENVADMRDFGDNQGVSDDWCDGRMNAISFYEMNHLVHGESDIQYQSLPDLSASSRESLSCTVQRATSDSKHSDIMSRSNEEMYMSTDSNTSIDESIDSSEKSYGKPPSLPKSLQSMGGSFGKIEERLTSWVEPKHSKMIRSRSSGADDGELTTKLPHQPSLPSDLNEFFQHLGLTSDQYNELTAANSRSCSPMFFSSRGSVDSTDQSSCTTQRSRRSTSPPAPSPVSVVQTNARVVKWLCKTSQWL